ncbi:hypothetical protein HOK00_08390, partial [bacterium]|nr:hypothetical protein [bacterium]
MAQLYNLKETYLVLIENIEIFNKLLDKSNFLIEKGKKSNDIRNSFLVSSYQDILDDFIDNKVEGLNQRESRKWRRVSEVLEYKHLVKRNLFSEGPKIDSLETFTIELSLLNIVKNIYQERAKPLNKTQYIDYENTIRTYKDYFENNYFKRTDDRDLQEKIESFENKLENISSEILKSIEALKYETSHNFKDKKTLGLEQTKSNYKKAKDLQDRYIIPSYRFTNVKTSSFMSM